MELITIDNSNGFTLDWTARGKNRIIQNFLNILNTYKYEVAYNRDLGLSPELLDKDAETMKSMIMEDLFDNAKKYLPQATLKEVEIKEVTSDGHIKAVIKIEV